MNSDYTIGLNDLMRRKVLGKRTSWYRHAKKSNHYREQKLVIIAFNGYIDCFKLYIYGLRAAVKVIPSSRTVLK